MKYFRNHISGPSKPDHQHRFVTSSRSFQVTGQHLDANSSAMNNEENILAATSGWNSGIVHIDQTNSVGLHKLDKFDLSNLDFVFEL